MTTAATIKRCLAKKNTDKLKAEIQRLKAEIKKLKKHPSP